MERTVDERDAIAERIYRIMRDKLMNQSAVARQIGVTPQAFNDMLKGRRSLRLTHIQAICNALDCEPNDLFGYESRRRQIAVTDKNNEVVAVIADNTVIEREGYSVVLA